MAQSESTAPGQLVVFKLGEEEYGLPIQTVQEVIRYQQPRSVSSSDQTLLGVINLRGRIVPVHDVCEVLGIRHEPLPAPAPAVLDAEDEQAAEDESDHKIVLVNIAERIAGVVVDDVSEVMSIGADEFEDLPASGNPLVDGVVKHGERLIILLDAPALTDLSGAEAAAE